MRTGSDPKVFSRQYETKLRQAELESIQDYIAESDNLVALHSQVGAGCCLLLCLWLLLCVHVCVSWRYHWTWLLAPEEAEKAVRAVAGVVAWFLAMRWARE